MLDESWLPGIRSDLRSNETACLTHMKNNTFHEEPFVEYFKAWDSYFTIISNFGAKDEYDASSLPSIAAYYNANTKTNNRYDERTGVKSQVSSSSQEPEWKKYLIGAGIVLAAILLLRGCAHGETMDLVKKELNNSKGKRIMWEDPNFIAANMQSEVINASSYPVLSRTLK